MREEEKAGMKRYQDRPDVLEILINNQSSLLKVEILEQGIEREDNGEVNDDDDDEGPPDLTYFPYVGPGR